LGPGRRYRAKVQTRRDLLKGVRINARRVGGGGDKKKKETEEPAGSDRLHPKSRLGSWGAVGKKKWFTLSPKGTGIGKERSRRFEKRAPFEVDGGRQRGKWGRAGHGRPGLGYQIKAQNQHGEEEKKNKKKRGLDVATPKQRGEGTRIKKKKESPYGGKLLPKEVEEARTGELSKTVVKKKMVNHGQTGAGSLGQTPGLRFMAEGGPKWGPFGRR